MWRSLLLNADYLIFGSPIGTEISQAKKGKELITLFGMFSIIDLQNGTLVVQCEEHIQFEKRSSSDDLAPLMDQYYHCFENQSVLQHW